MPRVAFILLHRGRNDRESRVVLEKIEESGISGITEIHVRSDKTKDWLMHNSKNVEVKSLPSFLVAQEGKKTEIYRGSEYNTIFEMLRELTS